MNMIVEQVAYENKAALRHLIELYLYDFSEFTHDDVNEFGLYDYKYVDHYWSEPDRFPFFIKVEDKLAGFALIRSIKDEDTDHYHSMAEFFIMKKYRQRDVGRKAAISLFEKFSGRWEVSVIKENKSAYSSWRKTIGKYLYTEKKNEDGVTTFFFYTQNH
ncbi:GNAT family N-acetyltransferase [Rossellomorea aquimaris]|uniref:Putative acetyltransferase n=1 Tax=Rossellomorea aquimaris TaxID=189382 RepID=A0A366ERA5_9BACI|nr:GNAT family N-acetyltransferase [Rossellomorea aquimaris]RBP04466.1 putative acetyltransferase [Rossellomorea aquimaris]